MQTISIVNMKGGVGKSTLSVNIADVLARRHNKRVLLIDTDPQFNATQMLVDGETYIKNLAANANTVLDIFDDQPKIRTSTVAEPKIIPPTTLEDIKPWQIRLPYPAGNGSLNLLAGDLELYRLEMKADPGRVQRLRRYIEICDKRDLFDFAIIDTPPTPSDWMTAALYASTHYIIPVRPEPISRAGVDLLKGVVDRTSSNFGHKIECLGVVLTIADEHYNVFSQAVAFLDQNNVWKGKRFQNHLPRRAMVAEQQGNQTRLLDIDNTDTKRAITGITYELLQRIQNAN
jgi:chromosome partitioning protein